MAGEVTSADRDLYGVKSSAFGSVSAATITAVLDARYQFAMGYFAAHFDLPLVTLDVTTKMCVCQLADYDLMSYRGYNPEGIDLVIRQRYEDWIAWLKLVAEGKVTPQVVDSSAGSEAGVSTATPQFISDEQRGFSTRGTTDNYPFDGVEE